MKLAEHQQRLDSLLAAFQPLWHAQPFHETRPAWCAAWPALTADLLALDDDAETLLAADDVLATEFVTRHFPDLGASGRRSRPLPPLPVVARYR